MAAHGTMAHGPGRRPVRVRWPRRIAGVLATAALFGVAVAMAMMVMPGSGTGAGSGVSDAPAVKPHAHAAKTHHSTGLTKAQLAARADAVSGLRSQGYEPVRERDFEPRHTLRVLIGYRSGEPLGPRRAFFFGPSGPVGTDSTAPSSALKLVGAGRSWATLSYGVFTSGDRSCCPSGGRTKVRFALSGGTLAPVGGTVPASWQRIASG